MSRCRHDWIEPPEGVAPGTSTARGVARALCSLCGTTFPCRRQPCEHVDCRLSVGNNEPPPGVQYPEVDHALIDGCGETGPTGSGPADAGCTGSGCVGTPERNEGDDHA